MFSDLLWVLSLPGPKSVPSGSKQRSNAMKNASLSLHFSLSVQFQQKALSARNNSSKCSTITNTRMSIEAVKDQHATKVLQSIK